MKKSIYLILFLSLLTSCSQDLVFNNNAAFQGVKDNLFWKADDAAATIDSGNSLNIQAVTLNETLTLKIKLPSTLVSQKDVSSHLPYELGKNEIAKATYVQTLNTIVSTYETGAGIGDGQIVVTDYDGETISGTYRFNAKNKDTESESSLVNFQKGVFYKVPITP